MPLLKTTLKYQGRVKYKLHPFNFLKEKKKLSREKKKQYHIAINFLKEKGYLEKKTLYSYMTFYFKGSSTGSREGTLSMHVFPKWL